MQSLSKTMRMSGLFLILTLLYSPMLFAQADWATITGTVKDSSGAVIPGVQVLTVNVGTGTRFQARTNSVGVYTIPGLPVGSYTLKVSNPGFEDYVQTGIVLIAAQVLEINVPLAVGSSAQTVTVSGGAPLLETETTTVSMTMEQSALRDLPLNSYNGRDALNLLLATTQAVNTSQGGQGGTGTQNWNIFAGGETMSNSVYVDGIESTAGNQGQIPTPGLDALQEVQIQTYSSDAEFGTGGGVELFQLKSGTNQLHGSAFEYLQNEALNANTWSNNYFLSQCAPSDATCIQDNTRARDRFNDWGGSAGGPIWRNHAFIFGDFELYNITDDRINPNSQTVPTPQMLTGDFSQLLTGGSQQGNILDSNGSPIINPCTGQPYQYGQIFDPQTQQVIGGVTCATPFQGNVIPPGRLSAESQKVAAIYTKFYAPTITSRIYNNFPTMVSGNPSNKKTTVDLKFDENLSDRHHLSVAFDNVTWTSIGLNGGFDYSIGDGPLSSFFATTGNNRMFRVLDSYTVAPNVLNTFGIGFDRQPTIQRPQVNVNSANYGFNIQNTAFPVISFGPASNGIGYSSTGGGWNAIYTYNAWHLQDTAVWTHGRHNIKFGGTFMTQGLNSTVYPSAVQQYNFTGDTGGPIDPSLTPFVGSGLATEMLGNVQSANQQVPNQAYPRQKSLSLFAQDDYRITPRLTLNLGLRWDVTLPGHEAAGRWQNFDITAQNPAWGSALGAWVFSNNSGTTFETNEDYRQFGPHLGGAYELNNRLIARASYGLFFVPLGAFSSGAGPWFPANQTGLAFPINQVLNDVVGATAFNWDGGYPGVPALPPQNSSATSFGLANSPMYIHPDILHLGYTQNWNVGTEYEISKNSVLDFTYLGNRGSNLHNDGRSIAMNYPDFGAYQALLLGGHINDFISSPSDAAADGISYPYPGFAGPAYAAIAHFPQVASQYATVASFGDPTWSAISNFNAFIAEVKARNTHGLYVDFGYTLSKMTGSDIGLDNFANNWGYPAQDAADLQDSKHWVQSFDQRHLAKGYVTYLLPFGRGREWLAGLPTPVNAAIGGWELGYYGSYGSGTPFGPVVSTFQLPYYYSTQRANLGPGQTAYSLHNHFGGHLDLGNLSDASNTDFNRNLFTTTSAAAPFGNSPYTFNHWRWNPGAAQENLSIMKHFGIGSSEHFQFTVAAQFFNVLNRHYYNRPDTNLNDTTFGQVTGVSGNRTGQLSARIEW